MPQKSHEYGFLLGLSLRQVSIFSKNAKTSEISEAHFSPKSCWILDSPPYIALLVVKKLLEQFFGCQNEWLGRTGGKTSRTRAVPKFIESAEMAQFRPRCPGSEGHSSRTIVSLPSFNGSSEPYGQ